MMSERGHTFNDLCNCNNRFLSYDVAVFQCITSCYKKYYEHMCINTFAGIRNDAHYNVVNLH